MRICITRSQRSTYSETFIKRQIDELSKRCEVLTLHSGRMPSRVEDGRRIHSLPFWIGNLVLKAITGNRNNYFSNYGMKKILLSNQVELVLANYGLSAVHMVPVCRDLNIPLIPHFHGYDATQLSVLKKYGAGYRQLFEYAPAIIAVSNVMKKQLVKIGAPEEKVKIIPYGIQLNQFNPDTTKKATYPLLLAVGRFTEKKAPHVTIRAFHEVIKLFPDAKLVMIGGREEAFEQCQQLVRALSIESAVEFPGILPPDKIADYMKRAHLFVQHSVTASNGDMEGTPNSILEAAASGLPIVSTRHGGIMDAVVEGETGILVDEWDEKGMVEGILQLLYNPDQMRVMGQKARLHMEQHYSIEQQIQSLFDLMKSTLEKS
ncbi:glycosyltransferase [Flavihumibacter cheonanensis]|uniref:glycosyltransferase family 4 protein n=1 Tax=Flavihumibacter cheonanensis TaxID=1442385 RepID=UPI001EF8B453|nr:glycosyltransferase family 4 protein [Flavihumibacter cheonanensis]MCG7751965.1 glycosyltransferase family 4 protein [Flavihumibacter cheonanensis]